MIQNGLQRLAIINSAGYSRAEMPLDDSCSIVAPNNTGKTSLINAMQYVFIADGTRLNFGEHSRQSSRKFYFPGNTSYVLAQLQLDEGEVVIGCVGKGHAHDYEYFAYKGALNLDDFRAEDGSLIAQPQLKTHMAELGSTIYTYSPREFSDGLYGHNRKRPDHEPNFNLFRLEQSSYTGVFQTVLARTLRLDRLTSSDVKRFLLEIYKHELTDAEIDFQAAWDRAFRQVNEDRAQFIAAQKLVDRITDLGTDLERLLAVRGKVLAHRPVVDDLLRQWSSNFKVDRTTLEMQLASVSQQLDDISSKQADLSVMRERARTAIAKIEADQVREAHLATSFALIQTRSQIEDRLVSIVAERDRLVALISNASARSAAALQREIDERQASQRHAVTALSNVENNLHLQLMEALGSPQTEVLTRMANHEVLTLGPDAFILDPDVLVTATNSAITADRLQLPGLTVDTAGLTLPPPQRSREEWEQVISELTARLDRLHQELETANAIDAAIQQRTDIESSIKGIESQLNEFDEFQALLTNHDDRESRLQQFLADRLDLDGRLSRVKAETQELREEETKIGKRLGGLDADNSEVERLRDGRRDNGPPFDHLAALPHHDWVQPLDMAVRDLPKALPAYISDCQELKDLTVSLRTGVSDTHAAGLTKFIGVTDSGVEAEIQRMVNFAGALPQEAETLERAARQAVVEVSSALHDIRRSLSQMDAKMAEFNRLISQRRLSDLAVFKLKLVEVGELVDAMDMLLSTAELADSGQSFALFNQNDDLTDGDLKRAKSILIREGQNNNGLKLENLFRLEFHVAKRGHPVESFQDLDQSASNGTILIAKLVIGLTMLHLMRDKRHPTQAVCYLDEASSLDTDNQKSLVETAKEFGFSLIFASPLPQTTTRYCVPIDSVDGKNMISRQRWQVIEQTDVEDTAA